VLVRDLRRVSSRLDQNPAGYLTGKTQPEEFEPQ
jgi:phospholipid/cholesterol/gamma-HCH transport system substrate-binding protein